MMMPRISVLLFLCAATALGGYGLKWSVTGLGPGDCTITTGNPTMCYDVDGDGISDLLFDIDHGLKIYSGISGSLIWELSTAPDTVWYGDFCGIYVAQTDQDANNEVVLYVGRYEPRQFRIEVYDCVTHSLEFSTPWVDDNFWYRVADVDGDGQSEICTCSNYSDQRLDVYGWLSGVEEQPGAQPAQGRGSASPNPARRVVRFNVLLAQNGSADVTISDAAGRVVRAIPVDGPAGIMAVTWDCRGQDGQPVSTGTYFYQRGESKGKVEVVR